MGRPKSIDRDHLLDVAEDIVRTRGAAALTIDAVAKAAGITKGGVQYSFASKAALIDALGKRWVASYDALFSDLIPADPSPLDVIRAHVGATFSDNEPAQAKAASVMTALLQSPEFMGATQAWYRDKLVGLDTTTRSGRRAMLAFLATEGAFCLRFLGLMEIEDATWDRIFADIGTELLEDAEER